MLLQADDVDNGAFWVRSNVTLAGWPQSSSRLQMRRRRACF